MRLYTRQGDDGRTSLADGRRVYKDDPRITACGEVDELNSVLGWCRCVDRTSSWAGRIEVIQRELFSVGAELAMPEVYRAAGAGLKGADEVSRLESWIDEACAATPPLACFILPGGTESSARLHIARTVCRRAERTVVRLREDGAVRGAAGDGNPTAGPFDGDGILPGKQQTALVPRSEIIVYLNRLGDLLFAWARLADRDAGVADVPWKPSK